MGRKPCKGYQEYKTPSGKIRYGSYIIVDRKVHRIATHDSKEIAYMAHIEAMNMIENNSIDYIKQTIRNKTLRPNDFTGKYRNV